MSVLEQPPYARDLWVPRRQLSLEKARKRSARVLWIRRLFVVSAAVCIGVFAGYLAANAILKANSGVIDLEEEGLTMLNPRFTGRDDTGEPYIITADSASRSRHNDKTITLYNPRIADDYGGLISAPTGEYDQDAQTLLLFGNVVAADPGGYVFSSSRAMIYVKEGRIEGLNPLKGNGPIGEFTSKEYEILEDGARLVMTGDVKITLYAKERDKETGGNDPE